MSFYKKREILDPDTEKGKLCEDTDKEGRWPSENRGRSWSFAAANQGLELGMPEAGKGKKDPSPSRF